MLALQQVEMHRIVKDIFPKGLVQYIINSLHYLHLRKADNLNMYGLCSEILISPIPQ